jgi:RNA polymerase sigma-70 factor (ECF subfamily)
MKEDLKLLTTVKDEMSPNADKQKAFGILYNKYRAIVKNYIYQIAGGENEFTREEILSITLAKAFIKIDSFNLKFPFIIWLRRIALNTFIDMRRKRNRRDITHVDISKTSICDDSYNPYSKVVQKQSESALHQFIQRLSNKHREVVILRLNHNFSCKQISEKLKLPIGTVTTILYRSRILIKKSGLCEI